METTNIKISDLKPADYNPRIMPEAEMKKLMDCIVSFGFVDPVIVNKYPGRENVIVGGHQRVSAAQRLGMTEVPAVYVELPIEREKLLNLALNRISGQWDEVKLREILAGFDQNVNVLLSGFDGVEIDDILKGINEKKEEDFDITKELESIKTPESKPGEVYELGNHRLMCGDSVVPESVDKLMAGAAADMVFTDPPYNIGYKSAGKKRDVWAQAYGDDDYTPEQFEEFCFKAFGNFKRYLKKGGVYYICSGWASWSAFWRALLRINLRPRGCIIWDKGHGGLGWSDYWYQQEMMAAGFNEEGMEEEEIFETIAYGFNDKAKHYFAKKGGARLSDVWRIAREPSQTYQHPTQKPVKLIENAIYNSSKIGENVLDLFGGSGSTLIAAERTGRRSFLMERSPLFCDVIRKRYEKFTNKK